MTSPVKIGLTCIFMNREDAIDRIAKQLVTERQDITGSNCLKGVLGRVIVDEKGIKDS